MLFNQDARYYAQKIKDGHYLPSDLVAMAIENIETLNPQLNAVNHYFFDYARQLAKDYDKKLENLSAIERQKLPPFFGVPFLLKDLGQNLAGFPSTDGAQITHDNLAAATVPYTKKVLAAGFIIVGRTNVPEFGLKTVSDSSYYGTVRHPLKANYNPGGSSGGAAAAVKSGMVPIAGASDAGGSIRVPASDCGLIGLKPSQGRIADGQTLYHSLNNLGVNFVLSKSIEDSFAFLKACQGRGEDGDKALIPISESALTLPDKPLRVAYLDQDLFGKNLDQASKDLIDKGISGLQNLGAQVDKVTLDLDGREILTRYYHCLLVETGYALTHFIAHPEKISFDSVDPLTWLAYKLGPQLPAFTYVELRQSANEIYKALEELFGHYDVLLTPSTAGSAMANEDLPLSNALLAKIRDIDDLSITDQKQVVQAAFDHYYLRTPYSQWLNISGHPAISLPIKPQTGQMSRGLQVIGKMGADYELLQVGKLFAENNLLEDQSLQAIKEN
ncbi:amidase family protein [Aerococcus kribbianus]|uniref:Amidase family protein n=1 Tax=Aerococcus kribbianus TaxID=2999064 RepID=A0A9X3JEQ5_9LACT|nr:MULTISPECIES: amidase family protein [unclassified Aerococcus]MCZ0716853.1 amidase family protein [Aerococcus sp. YH-aer221]MCZ0725141.1 amidase family protein [Aerococcus sp. YH-aer222]